MLQGKGILTNLQKEILFLFSQIPDAGEFFLTGGTALSEFYLQHRLSYVDFFTSQDGQIEPFSEKLSESLKAKGFEVQTTRRFQTFAEFRLGEGSGGGGSHGGCRGNARQSELRLGGEA